MLQTYIHTIYNNTHNTCKMILSTVKWAQWDKTQSREMLDLFICVCIALCTIVAHNVQCCRRDLIIFPLTIQTLTIAPMMSIWGKRVGRDAAAVTPREPQSPECGSSSLRAAHMYVRIISAQPSYTVRHRTVLIVLSSRRSSRCLVERRDGQLTTDFIRTPLQPWRLNS